MLIINKNYSNLLDGYKRAQELNQQLENEWNSKYKPELLNKLLEQETKQKKEYQFKMLAWQESEKLSIKEWEETEKRKIDEWESNEITRHSIYERNKSLYNQQNRPKNEQLKQEKIRWMIAWISSSIFFFCLSYLILPLVNVGFILKLLGAVSAMALFSFAIAAFIVFVIKASSRAKPYPSFIPSPKPQPGRRISTSKPIAPNNAEYMIEKYSCPSVISQWVKDIQYQDQGKEYFRKLAKDNPEAISGIPGEMAMLNEHIGGDRIDFEGIYILGFKTSKNGDIDGISITRKGLWILESKYLLGNVEFRNGNWKQSVFVRHPGQNFLDGWVEKEFDKPLQPDIQLENALKIIKRILSDYSKENSWITDAINGTIVFTHDNTDLNISNCDFLYAKNYDYLSLIFKGQDIDEMTFEKQLEIADLLLTANHEYEKEEVSAVKFAENIYDQSIKSLEKLIKSPSIY